MTKKKSTKKRAKKHAAKPVADLSERIVLVVFAEQNDFTIEEWDERLAHQGFQLEEIMTPNAWKRRVLAYETLSKSRETKP